jgi:hypothetical protein
MQARHQLEILRISKLDQGDCLAVWPANEMHHNLCDHSSTMMDMLKYDK